MRVAFLSHFYPPSPCGGAGYFTAALAEGLSRSNIDVGVLCVDRWGEGPAYFNGCVEDFCGDVKVRRLHVNWRKAPRPFDYLYDSPILAEQAREFFGSYKPDIVHVSSMYALSARPVFEAKELGIPIVMHLHDYWNICARHTLLHKDNSVCSGPTTPHKCQRCLLAGTKVSNFYSLPLNNKLQDSFVGYLARNSQFARLRGLRGMLGNVEKRSKFVLEATKAADVRITPTEFARRVLIEYGVPSEKTIVMPYGLNLDWVSHLKPVSSKRLRIGYLGNVIPIKGVDVLVRAYQTLLEIRPNAHVSLDIWGDTTRKPDYVEAVRRDLPRLKYRGRYRRRDLSRILSSLDVIVVPSIWYETQGIVIQEAFAGGVPVVVSDGTSLTETVRNGVDGLHFQMGSAKELATALRRLLEEPGLLDSLRANIQPVHTIEEDVEIYSSLYERLL